jgi:hypothetical protein
MAYTAHPTVTTGQAWTSTDQETYVKNNFDAIFPVIKGWQGNTTLQVSGPYWGTSTSQTVITPFNRLGEDCLLQVGSAYVTGSTIGWYFAYFPITYQNPSLPIVIARANSTEYYIATVNRQAFAVQKTSTDSFVINWIVIGPT